MQAKQYYDKGAMNFLLYTPINKNTIRSSLGKSEYSYYFVLKAFEPIFERLGNVILVNDPNEVDPIVDACTARDEPSLLVSFCPPDKALLTPRCPTLVILAWEYSTIPDGSWSSNPRDDWRYSLAKLGHAISLSSYTAEVVKEALGQDYPIIALAAPVFDRMGSAVKAGYGAAIKCCALRVSCDVFDSVDYLLIPNGTSVPELRIPPPIIETSPLKPLAPLALEEPALLAPEPLARGLRYRLAVTKRHVLEWYREAVRDLLPRAIVRLISRIGIRIGALSSAWLGKGSQPIEELAPPQAPSPPPPLRSETLIDLQGVVYTAVFNPSCGRKNWSDILTAFCTVFRDVENVTLILKMVCDNPGPYHDLFLSLLARLGPMKCRVIAIGGFLEEPAYRALMDATSFYVNCSRAEGLCLPLMEFMTLAKPVIAPNHTAMRDYIDETAAFIVTSNPEQNIWPGVPTLRYCTMWTQPHWESLASAYRASYDMAKNSPERYQQMSSNAARIMRDFSGDEAVERQLSAFIRQIFSAQVGKTSMEPGPVDLSQAVEAFVQ